MDSPPDNKKLSEIVDKVRSWIPRRMEPTNLSRDFWMPDQSCRVCYECDAQFTVFNRRHHCRLCGRVFCAKCAANSIPAPPDECKRSREEWERIRVCNYCFKQWEQGIPGVDNGIVVSSPGLSPSSSVTSLVSMHSTSTCNSGSCVSSAPYSTGPYQHVAYTSGENHLQCAQSLDAKSGEGQATYQGKSSSPDPSDSLPDHFRPPTRSDDEEEDYSVYRLNSEPGQFLCDESCYATGDHILLNQNYAMHELDSCEGKDKACMEEQTLPSANAETNSSEVAQIGNGADGLTTDLLDGDTQYEANAGVSESLDFEKNGMLWIPSEPENEEDDQENLRYDDDDDYGIEGVAGDWGYLKRSRSFGGMVLGTRERTIVEHRKAMKNLLDDHFRTLISQFLQIEDVAVRGVAGEESWLEIILSLCWEAATLLKPDMSKNGVMDPGVYVKVKCIASGRRSDSTVVKGVVCKKNVSHRRMTAKINKARIFILGGALEYQRVANHLSSFDTLLQQEMDHLKMAVAKIDAHHPNVLLVEKSVSRFAQEYLLAKDISLVLNIKRPLLERIARCTGAQIVPSVDHITAQKIGYCDSFHVEKFFEDHGSAGQGGKKATKTLMFFEGCPKPLGCTILLKGASGDELKKIKQVVHYGVFAAYHLALETSFLADEGASLLEMPLKSPIKVVLPGNLSSLDRSISFVPGSSASAVELHGNPQTCEENTSCSGMSMQCAPCPNNSLEMKSGFTGNPSASEMVLSHVDSLVGECKEFFGEANYPSCLHPLGSGLLDGQSKNSAGYHGLESEEDRDPMNGHSSFLENSSLIPSLQVPSGDNNYNNDCNNEEVSLKDSCPTASDDHQSILVSLTTRSEWKGTVCERAHLFRIKYYGSFDKPLGRFLRDHLFDQNYRCHSCTMPSEAHIHCYTHRQGSLTISVRRLQEIILPGEHEDKIWMWHRCLRCPRTDGFPPATRRIIMSDAAWGLSFGKFLELSFSNHAAASRVASCGHSIHRDCLRFYGFGRMIACFRYAPISVHAVYLPPPKLEFVYDRVDWAQEEADEVQRRAESLFGEVVKSVQQIMGKAQVDNGDKISSLIQQCDKLKEMLQNENKEFEEMLSRVLKRETRHGQPAIDILEINKLRRQMVLYAYVWDQRLVQASILIKNRLLDNITLASEGNDKTTCSDEKPDVLSFQGGGNLCSPEKNDKDRNSCHLEDAKLSHPSGVDMSHVNSEDSSKGVRRSVSEGQFPVVDDLSDTLDAAWTGESQQILVGSKSIGSTSPEFFIGTVANQCMDNWGSNQGVPTKSNCGVWMPFTSFYQSFDRNFPANGEKFDKLNGYNPVHILSYRELLNQNGARLFLPTGVYDCVIPVYDDEPTSIIAYALVSPYYRNQMSKEYEKPKDVLGSSASLPNLQPGNLLPSFDEGTCETLKSPAPADELISPLSGSRTLSTSDPLLEANDLHVRLSFSDDSPIGKVKYTVTCYHAKRFEALRQICCPSELDFIRSLSRCKNWGAQGGKSNVFFAKTLDDRFIIKQVTKTELESFIKYAPAYFKYLSDSVSTGSPTCLAKILGIYQVTSKHLKGGKESRMDVLVMENLLYRRNIVRLYDLKGSSRSRYNPDASGSNKVLLDENLLETMPTSPIFVGTQAKRLLERAVWNDTQFLGSVDVMDYSLLVGVDEEKHELVLGIIDFMRQYTWDKHLETWVKTSGLLGGSKNSTPTVISPKQYKKRFRKAMSAYFVMVPDQWSSSSSIIPTGSQD